MVPWQATKPDGDGVNRFSNAPDSAGEDFFGKLATNCWPRPGIWTGLDSPTVTHLATSANL